MNNLPIALGILLAVTPAHAASPPEIQLWPQGMPAPKVPNDPPEKTKKGPDGITRRWNVSQPRLFVHEPPTGEPRSGAAVIVLPGGGFGRLADEHEGSDACRWLAKNGVLAFQLAYRTPTTQHNEPNAGPVQDAQKAVLEVRRRAADWKLDAKKIGLLGFSAGGQVALIAATNARTFSDEAVSESHAPDFLLLIYPFKIYDPAKNALRADIGRDSDWPPMFIAQAGDDASSLPQGSATLYLELIQRKTPAELHIYENGGHGFGLRPRVNAVGPTDWPLRAADWLRLRGYATTPN